MDRLKLTVVYDNNNKLRSASINWELEGFHQLVENSIGKDWNTFVTDLMFLNYSHRRYANELQTLRLRHIVKDDRTTRQVSITFANSLIQVIFQLPEDYPRVGEMDYDNGQSLKEIKVVSVISSDLYQNTSQLKVGLWLMDDRQSMFNTKVYYNLVDFVQFIEQYCTTYVE